MLKRQPKREPFPPFLHPISIAERGKNGWILNGNLANFTIVIGFVMEYRTVKELLIEIDFLNEPIKITNGMILTDEQSVKIILTDYTDGLLGNQCNSDIHFDRLRSVKEKF